MSYLMYYTEMMSIVRSLQGMNVKVDEADQLHYLLHGLAPEFEMLKMMLLTMKTTTLATAHEMLTQHADRLSFDSAATESSGSELFYLGGRGRSGGRFQRAPGGKHGACFTCNSPDHQAFDCPKNAGKKKCNFCRHVGSHIEAECRKKKAAAINGEQKPSSTGGSNKKSTQGNAPRTTLCVLDDSEEEVFVLGMADDTDGATPHVATPNASDSAMTSAAALHVVDTDQFSRAISSKKAPESLDMIRLTLDSGATIATCKNLAHLSDVRSVPAIRVKTASNTTAQLHLAGTLRLRSPDGAKTIVIRNVYYWPECPVNIISVGSLTRDASKEVVFMATEAIVRRTNEHGGDAILRIPKRGSLYVTDLRVITEEQDAQSRSSASDQTDTQGEPGDAAMPAIATDAATVLRWHYRTGHIGKRALGELTKSAAVRGLDSLTDAHIHEVMSSHPQCHGCAVGKTTRKAFSRHNSGIPASEILDVMHADVKGPLNVPSASGKRYVLCLTDERSRRTWGFLLKQKSESEALIKALLTQLRVETGKTLRVFHADNGGEFISNSLLVWLEQQGTKFDPTTPGTPNHNSIAERAWRTIFNSTRAMLHHADLPSSLWGHAVMTAILLKNKTLTSVNGALTPEVIWHQQAWRLNHKHSLSETPAFVTEMKNLRVFGCNAYVHLQGRKSLDARAARGVFLGYADEAKGYYYLLDVERKKLIRSRDVKFDEEQFSFAREVGGIKGELMQSGAITAQGVAESVREIDTPAQESFAPAVHADGGANAHDSPAASAQGEIEDSADDADAADEDPRDDNHADDDGDDDNMGAASSSSNALAPRSKPKTIFDDVRSSNIVHSRRSRQQLNYREGSNNKPVALNAPSSARGPAGPRTRSTSSAPVLQSHRQGKAFVVQAADTNDAAIVESDSNDEIEDPEPDFTPITWRQAMTCANAAHWKRAAEDEIRGMQMSGSYELVPRPTGPHSNVIDSKWVWKKKLDQFNRVKRFRARLTARGFKQIAGVDFFETFAPVMRYKSLMILLAFAAERDYEVRHLDVPKAFLQATLSEEIYMEQPEGFHNGDRNQVWKLLKSVYGIRQAPNNWNNELNQFLLSIGFTRLKSDPCIYVKPCRESPRQITLGVFVDDIIPIFDAADDATEWQPLLRALEEKYKIVDTGDASLVLGIRLTRDRPNRTIRLDHAPYIAKTLKEFQMEQCNPVTTPSGSYAISKADCPAGDVDAQMRALFQRIVGALNYAAISIRLDIAFAVNTLARYMQNPGEAHLTAAKRVLRYLRHTPEIGLVLGGRQTSDTDATTIDVWSDADWATNPDNRRSITGYVIQVNGSIISWQSKQQTVVAKSTCEAETYALSAAVSESKWVRMFVRELHGSATHRITTVAHVDNTAAIAVSKNDVHHSRTKHIDLRHHHVREAVEKNLLQLEHVPSAEQLADILTKPLARVAFERLRECLMR